MIFDKRAISAVVATVIMIALVVFIAGITWIIVNNLVSEQISEAESCVNVFDKVKLNNRYTCYNSSGNELQISIDIDDLEVDEVLVSVSSSGSSSSFSLNKTLFPVLNVVSYPDRSSLVSIPGKNSGLTYIFDMDSAGLSGTPDTISIAPTISGNQCEKTDSINEIDNCFLLS